MTVTSIDKDVESLQMTITAQFDAPVEQVWQVWNDPRQLERWWGPPTYPATVVDHNLTPNGRVTYFMTGPEGDKHHGWWQISSVEPPHRLEFIDGFADSNGTPEAGMPVTTTQVTLQEDPAGTTRMRITSQFASAADMERLLAMGMDEGMSQAMGQIDGLLTSQTV